MEDQRNILRTQRPFSWKLTKNGKALIYWNSKLIKTLMGADRKKLEKVVAKDDSYQIQLFLARMTGNFKHGNERSNKPQ